METVKRNCSRCGGHKIALNQCETERDDLRARLAAAEAERDALAAKLAEVTPIVVAVARCNDRLAQVEAERDALRIALADAAIRLRAASHSGNVTAGYRERLRRWADEADAAFHAARALVALP